MNSFKKVSFLLLMAFIAIYFLLPPGAYSQPFQRHGGQHIGPPRVMQNLSSEQKEELLSLIAEMRESGASREEISETRGCSSCRRTLLRHSPIAAPRR